MTTLTTGLVGYHPEMNEPKPAAQIEARLGHYGKHWFIRCDPAVPMLKGRGIEFEQTETAATLVPGSRFVGWNKYKVTVTAFDKLCKVYAVSTEMLL